MCFNFQGNTVSAAVTESSTRVPSSHKTHVLSDKNQYAKELLMECVCAGIGNKFDSRWEEIIDCWSHVLLFANKVEFQVARLGVNT